MALITNYCLIYKIDDNQSLLINTLTSAMDIIENEIKLKIEDMQNGVKDISKKDDKELYEILKKRGYLFESKEDEKKILNRLEEISVLLEKKSYCNNFTISPNMGCNLRCTYCFESNDQHKEMNIMTDEQLDGIFKYILKIKEENKEHLENATNENKLSIRIFGGEPLLPQNKEIIKKILSFAYENNIGLGIVTNGTIVKPYIDLLKKYNENMSIQITLDGDRNIHDSRRIKPDGTGTFDIICENINELLKNNINIRLRVNIDKTNIGTLRKLEEVIIKRGWDNSDLLTVYAAPVIDFSGDLNNTMRDHEILEYLLKEGYCNDENSFLRSIVSPSIGYLNMFFNPKIKTKHCKMDYCGATSGTELCFSPDGLVTTCLTYSGKGENDIGTFDKKGVHLDKEKLNVWKKRTIFKIAKCRQCKYAFVCGGGCPVLAKEINGDMYNCVCSDIINTIDSYVNQIVIKSLKKHKTLVRNA